MNSTDLPPAVIPGGTDLLPTNAADHVLAAVAGHFTRCNPTDVLIADVLQLCIGAEAYSFVYRTLDGIDSATFRTESVRVSRAALAAAPEQIAGITRGEYALLLRKSTAERDFEWSEDATGPCQQPMPTGGRS